MDWLLTIWNFAGLALTAGPLPSTFHNCITTVAAYCTTSSCRICWSTPNTPNKAFNVVSCWKNVNNVCVFDILYFNGIFKFKNQFKKIELAEFNKHFIYPRNAVVFEAIDPRTMRGFLFRLLQARDFLLHIFNNCSNQHASRETQFLDCEIRVETYQVIRMRWNRP